MFVALLRGYGWPTKKKSQKQEVDEFGDPISHQDDVPNEIRNRFDTAIAKLPHFVSTLTTDDQLSFYALYKQATVGPADSSQRPSLLDPKARAKFSAWETLGSMNKVAAMEQYISKITSISGEPILAGKSSQQGWGLRPSTMAQETDEEVPLDADPVLDSFFNAAKSNDIESLATLLDRNPDLINSKNEDIEMSALHWAADSGSLEAARFLLENGADVNAIDDDLSTPLHLAASCEHAELVQLLLSYGADKEATDSDGHIAADLSMMADILNLLLPSD